MYMQPDLVSNNFTLIKELHTTFFMMLTWKSTSKKWSLTLARLTHFKGFWHSCYRMLNRIGLTYILTYVFDNCKSVTVIAINWKWRNWGQIIICFLFLLTSLELTTLGSILYWKMRKDLRLRDLTGRRGENLRKSNYIQIIEEIGYGYRNLFVKQTVNFIKQ